ncbi:hypothetical protein [Vibrio alginolyticus]|uniref:hypothetical protein n=1 Tax=Vibrio alginolyticus TaxID=663 RepID=UPI00211A3DAB|nr:hypothetical protein [Vibrio alginolyticus]MCQ9091230.1 hypothetical protein [Vibrio alginolyticus]
MKTRLKIKALLVDKVLEAFLSAIYFVVITAAMMSQIYKITNSEPHIYIKILILILVFIISLIIISHFMIRIHKKYSVWALNGNELTRGEPENLKINFNEIEQIIIGYPRTPINIFYSHITNYIVIIKLKDKKYMPIDILKLVHGYDIINELLIVNENKIIQDYTFSKNEIKLLKIRKRNHLLTLTDD